MDIYQVGLKQFWPLPCFNYEHGGLKNGWFLGQNQVTMAGSVWDGDSSRKLFITSNHINTNRKTWFRAVLTPASQKWQFLSWKPGHNDRVTQGPWNHHGNFLMPQITSILIGKHDHENEDGLTHVHIHLNYYISIMSTQIMSKNCSTVGEWFKWFKKKHFSEYVIGTQPHPPFWISIYLGYLPLVRNDQKNIFWSKCGKDYRVLATGSSSILSATFLRRPIDHLDHKIL